MMFEHVFSNRRALLGHIPKDGMAVEVGVLHGAFSEFILEILRPSKLILIDPWIDYQGHNGDESYRTVREKFGTRENVQIVRDYSMRAVPRLQNKSIAFAYVDAIHLYADCLVDLELLLPKMQSGGYICGHDYCQCDDFGVVRATAVFCDRHKLEISLMTDEPPQPWLDPCGNQPSYVAYNSYGIRIP